jgi:hypothetical protein
MANLRAPEAGVYRGTVWLFLRFVDKVSGEESRNAISAQTVEIDAVTADCVTLRPAAAAETLPVSAVAMKWRT